MAKKAKKKVHPMPKLGWQDMLLYWTLMLGSFVGAFAAFVFPFLFREHLADANPQVLTCSSGERSLSCLWLVFWLFLILIIIGAGPYSKRIPVFGRKDIKYGPPAYPRVFPLLMKNKPQYWESEQAKASKKKLRRFAIGALIATFLFSAAVFPQSLYGRYELRTDGTVVVFNCQNKETEHYYLHEIESVSLYTYYDGGKGSHDWEIGFKIRFTDNDDCRFNAYTLKDNRTDSFRELQRLKEIYKSFFSIEGQDKLPRVGRDQALTAEESKLLYALFDTQQP